MALRPYQPPNYPAKGGLACDPWGGLSCQLYPDFRVRGPLRRNPVTQATAAQLPDCDLTGSQSPFPRASAQRVAHLVYIHYAIDIMLVNDSFTPKKPAK